mgnify:CR=1 FL=1
MYDVAFLRQGEVFLQPVSVFAQRKRIVPDKGFYLTDIISEKTPFEETALVGGGKYDAKMRHQKNPFCEKSILKMALQTGTIGKDTQSELKRVFFRGMHVPKKTANRDLINAKTFENRRITPREKEKALF